jgi:hypothetical protein
MKWMIYKNNNMKNLFYLLLVVVIVVACGQSNEKKAEALIKEELKKSLYKPDTYKPIETKVDSAFAPYDDPNFFKLLEKMNELNSEYERLESKMKSSKSSMLLWSGSYQSAFDKNIYKEAKDKYEEAEASMEKLKVKIAERYKELISKIHAKREFIGYKVSHNYRADNNSGNTLIGNTIFFIDKDFKEVTYSIDDEDYNAVKDIIEQLEEHVKEVELQQKQN